MLRVIPNRLKAKAEELLVEQKAGFRSGRSTAEQTFYCRVIIEKHIQHQRDLFQNFIDFKKAFGRVWHADVWQILRSFNKEEGTGSSLSGTISELQQCGLLEQSARGVLLVNVRDA